MHQLVNIRESSILIKVAVFASCNHFKTNNYRYLDSHPRVTFDLIKLNRTSVAFKFCCFPSWKWKQRPSDNLSAKTKSCFQTGLEYERSEREQENWSTNGDILIIFISLYTNSTAGKWCLLSGERVNEANAPTLVNSVRHRENCERAVDGYEAFRLHAFRTVVLKPGRRVFLLPRRRDLFLEFSM